MRKNHSLNPVRKAGFFFLIGLALILGACAPTAITPEPAAIQSQEAAGSSENSTLTPIVRFASVQFTDSAGREVAIEKLPERVISLAPSITESVYAIGAGDQLVGRSEYCDYPEEALQLPTVGGFSASSISVEAIIDLEPDLVIGGSIDQAEIIEALADAGINGFVMEPNTIEEISADLQLLGKITGHEIEAEQVAADMHQRINTVEELAATIPSKDRVNVFYEVWHDPYMTTTEQTFIGELITKAGGINIFGDLQEDYPAISSEEIVEKDPQVILGPSNHSDQLTTEIISGREGWKNISAVKNGRIYIIDGNIISRAGPRVVDALEAIAHSLYPDYFKE